MTGPIVAPRYGVDDFETASIRSAAPSYMSDAPSYHSNHSTSQTHENVPAYTPRTHRSTASTSAVPTRAQTSTPRQQTTGLPPIPPVTAASNTGPNLHNFRIPNWSASNAPAARHYMNVAERRVSDARYSSDTNRRYVSADPTIEQQESGALRPLEDPYLVGEEAAAKARSERIARERGDDILIREDRQWDWFLSQMKDWDERERSWGEFRRDVDAGRHKKLLRRVGGRLF